MKSQTLKLNCFMRRVCLLKVQDVMNCGQTFFFFVCICSATTSRLTPVCLSGYVGFFSFFVACACVCKVSKALTLPPGKGPSLSTATGPLSKTCKGGQSQVTGRVRLRSKQRKQVVYLSSWLSLEGGRWVRQPVLHHTTQAVCVWQPCGLDSWHILRWKQKLLRAEGNGKFKDTQNVWKLLALDCYALLSWTVIILFF